MEHTTITEKETKETVSIPNLGFLGVGWIGKSRMEAVVSNGLGNGLAICDVEKANADEAIKLAPDAHVCDDLDSLLNESVDGVVIATPSAMHAKQSIASLQAGKAVFCQKPLGRNLNETKRIVEEARRADKLLCVDYSYRYTQGMQAIKELIDQEAFGKIYAIEAVFHNAYGPDKSWFYDPELSGGGCLMDLGSHMVDLVMWMLNFPSTEVLSTAILSKGKPIQSHWGEVEDYASAELKTVSGVNVKLGCSWKLPIGKDAEISLKLFGTNGGAAFYNVNGSFYDFQTEKYDGTSTTVLTSPPDDWGGRAIKRWANRLAYDSSYSKEAEELIKTAAVLEDIYNHSNR